MIPASITLLYEVKGVYSEEIVAFHFVPDLASDLGSCISVGEATK
jgi:hypothetical protein